MAVKKGYKQTEVGVIPEDWLCKSVGELWREGLIHKPMDGNHGAIHPKARDFVDFGIPFVMANDVKQGRVDFQRCSFIRKQQADSLLKGFSQEGDVLLTHKATMGKTAIVGKIEWEYIMLTPQVTYYRIADPQQLSNRYLKCFFDGSAFQKVLEVLSGGGTRSYLGIVGQHKLPVCFPPTLAEQEAIAGALSDADAWIESLEQLIAKKRQIKQGAMQELLTGKRRLPGFSDKWETKRLGDLGRCQRGVSYNPSIDLFSGDTNSSVRLLRSNNVQDATIVYSDIQFVASSRVSSEQYLQRNDILICMANGSRDLVGKAGRYCEEKESAYTFGAFMGAFRPASEMVNPVFCFYLFQTAAYRQHIAILLAGSSINNLTPDNLESHLVVVPNTLAEQTAIATVLSDMDTEIESLESKLAKAREIKKGMMQELLTGRIRLVN